MTEWTREEKEAFDKRVQDAIAGAKGRWNEILPALGVDERIVNRRNQPCPVCKDGTDRFQFTDKFGDGNYVCRSCGAGGGLKLLMAVRGLNIGEALVAVERWLGTSAASPAAGVRGQRSRKAIERRNAQVLGESKPIRHGDPVDRYLSGLGLQMDTYPSVLLCHPRLGYFEYDPKKDRHVLVGEYPAMVAPIVMPDGRIAALHRTYVLDGAKAPVPSPKKVTNDGYAGGSVHLAEPRNGKLGVSEGIENALAVMIEAGVPMWAAINAHNLGEVWICDEVDELTVYGDNDADSEFAGQVAAYSCAQAFVRKGTRERPHRATVHIPKVPGTDWKAVLQHKRRRLEEIRASTQATSPRLRAVR